MTILNTACPSCGASVPRMAVDRELVDVTLAQVFRDIREAPPERTRLEIIACYSAAMITLCGYCGPCADGKACAGEGH